MKCTECEYLVQREDISMMSRMMGYTAECSRTGILFKMESGDMHPLWCPLRQEDRLERKMEA